MNHTHLQRPTHRSRGFSLVELLAAVAIIGVISFMAIPSITRMRSDSERNVAITRVEALNLAQASLIQTRGRAAAELLWRAQASNDAKYLLLRPYLSYSEQTLTAYIGSDYQVQFNASITAMDKTLLFNKVTNQRVYY